MTDFYGAEALAPTHWHPSAKSYGGHLRGRPAAMLDRARDASSSDS